MVAALQLAVSFHHGARRLRENQGTHLLQRPMPTAMLPTVAAVCNRKPSTLRFATAGPYLGQGVFGDRQAKGRQLLQPLPSTRDSCFLGGNVVSVEGLLSESPLAANGLETCIDNELSHRRIAADVALPRGEQL